jgi:hypothetical protein
MNRRRLLLAVLLLVLAASAIWSYFSYPRQKTVAKLKFVPGTRAVADRHGKSQTPAADRQAEPRMLRVDLLENVPPYTQYRRNIFSPLFVDEETFMQRQAAAAAAAAARKALPPAVPGKPAPMPTGIQNELSAFKFHGFLQKDGRKTVFLAKGRDITPLKEGSTFAGRFVATSITDQVLILKVTGTGEEIIIPLIENEPLRLAR